MSFLIGLKGKVSLNDKGLCRLLKTGGVWVLNLFLQALKIREFIQLYTIHGMLVWSLNDNNNKNNDNSNGLKGKVSLNDKGFCRLLKTGGVWRQNVFLQALKIREL